MEIEKYDSVVEKLKKALKHKRFVHTMGVAYTAAALAMRHGADVDRALLAGLLHDCAKCFTDEEKLSLCAEGGIELSDVERENTALIHAKLGPYIAARDYGVGDPEILDAIRTHTTGEPGMAILQQIVYIADMIEPNREDNIPSMGLMREAAFADLDRGVAVISERMVRYLEESGSKRIDPATLATYEYYKEKL